MEVRIYDKNLRFLGSVDNSTSIRWRRRYYQPGEFEIHMPETASNVSFTQIDNYVWIRGKKECGIIESRVITDSKSEKTVVITGRFASSIYDRRLIKATTLFNGKVEEIMLNIVKGVNSFPNVQFGTLNGYAETVSFQATYKNVLTYLEKLSKYGNIGFRLRPDFTNHTLTFETYRGVDHSYSQNKNPRVMFSDDFNALTNSTLTETNKLLKNVVYVGGQGEGDARTYVVCGDDSLNGFERREEFLSATDVSKEDGMSDEDYRRALAQRGNDLLGQDVASKAVDGDILPSANFKYLTDYDLGDIVTLKKPLWGISRDIRITEIEEVYEHGAMVITPTLGDPIPDSIDWSDR